MDTRSKNMCNHAFITIVYSPKIEYLIVLMKCSICKLTGHNKRRCPTLQPDVEPEIEVEVEVEVDVEVEVETQAVEPDNVVSSDEPILQKYFVSSPTFPNDFPLIHSLIQRTTESIGGLLHRMLPDHSHTSLRCPASEGPPDSHPSAEIECSAEPSI